MLSIFPLASGRGDPSVGRVVDGVGRTCAPELTIDARHALIVSVREFASSGRVKVPTALSARLQLAGVENCLGISI